MALVPTRRIPVYVTRPGTDPTSVYRKNGVPKPPAAPSTASAGPFCLMPVEKVKRVTSTMNAKATEWLTSSKSWNAANPVIYQVAAAPPSMS
jgi:hypothetical protein